MPATRESLLVKIEQLEKQIQVFESIGEDTLELRKQLNEARSAFAATGVALNENTNLLKG
jgi:hypothetical protein